MTAREDVLRLMGVGLHALTPDRREALERAADEILAKHTREIMTLLVDPKRLHEIFDRYGYAQSTKGVYTSVARKMAKILIGEELRGSRD